MRTRRLDEAEFKATMSHGMNNAAGKSDEVLDIWPYVDSVPPDDLEGHSLCDGCVQSVYRSDDDRFEHVLVTTDTKNVFLVVVVDLAEKVVYGHRILDLNREYGLPTPGGDA